MTDEPIDPELDRLLGLLAEEERGAPDPAEHPGAATLSSYHARTLPPAEVSRVQEHLVACRQCREQLLEYAQFMGPMVVVGESTWIVDPNGSGVFIATIRVANARRSRPAPMRVSTN